jgi:hypothetical protein
VLDRLDRSDVRLIVSGHLHQHRDRSFGNQRHLWVPAVALSAPQDCGGDGRCGLTVLDFSSDGVEVTIEYPRGLVSHDLAAIKEHGRKRAESLVAASELDSNPVVPAVRFQLTARDFGLVFAPSFLRPACSIRSFGNNEIRSEGLDLRYRQKYRQNGWLPRTFACIFNAPRRTFLKNGNRTSPLSN